MKNQTIQTTLHYYRYDISDSEQQTQYKALCKDLKKLGLKVFDSISSGQSDFYRDNIIPLDGKQIELETDFLFNNQWNTAPLNGGNGLRVFDWAENIYPNRKIKVGHWLEQTEQMTEIRNHTYKCNYCGKNYYKPEISFCNDCLGSEYLTTDNLPLLFLTPISVEKRNFDGVNLPDGFLAEYERKQRENRKIRLEKAQNNKLASIQKDIKASEKEYAAFKMLIENNINFDNVIYYTHTDTFCFGWRNIIPIAEAEKIEQTLIDTGFTKQFNVQFKTV